MYLNAGCALNTAPAVENPAPLFICLGYSATVNGDGGIVVGFTDEQKAVQEPCTAFLLSKRILLYILTVCRRRLTCIFFKNLGEKIKIIIATHRTDISYGKLT